ncbi:MAG: hypothetical protein M3349_03035 [Actinomycetota bacterium]|nr:hypothetical protein [Actinomycetota bacterium]
MTTEPADCAAPGCANPVPRRPGPGRPAIYCSPDCRTNRRRPQVHVEIDHPDTSPDGRPVQRVWTVRLRRGEHVVVIANDLGWPSANALAGQLHDLLRPNPQQTGGTID